MCSNRRTASRWTADGGGHGRPTPPRDTHSSWYREARECCSSVEQKEAAVVGNKYNLVGWRDRVNLEILEPATFEEANAAFS